MTKSLLPKKLLIASGNPGKVSEYRELLSGLPLELIDLSYFPTAIEPEETGMTFAENAKIKAQSYAEQTGFWVLADDSGLEVKALDGAPGLFSARFGGRDTTFSDKMDSILLQLDGLTGDDRSARFVCVIAVSGPSGEVILKAEGECSGSIAMERLGDGGFGYDPIFVPEGFDRTFGELPDSVKQKIGHRGRASAIIIRKLLDFIEV